MSSSSAVLDILAFEPYDGGSHRAVRERIIRHSRHRWRWITRPARAWKWRMRLAALEMVEAARASGAFDVPVDVVLATSLMSLADLVAALPRRLRDRPTVLYMHENQAVYPARDEATADARDVHFALTNLASVRAADLVVWNSEWNRRSFAQGIGDILRHAPDAALGAAGAVPDGVVIWPPVEPPPPGLVGPADRVLHNPVRVVWPHRWEHDKGPDELLALAERLHGDASGPDVRWTILGQRFREVPAAIERFGTRFADQIDHIGFAASRADYWRHLARCDWVLSTARHEFFGIAAVEAMLAGCLPWLPDRLSYPELMPTIARGLDPARPPEAPERIRSAVRGHLEPALAANAVAAIDAAVDRAARAKDR